jgi:cephalosporin hydroxylase
MTRSSRGSVRADPEDVLAAAERFHRAFYDLGQHGGTWRDTRWFGYEVQKSPLDLWIYQEIINDTHPDLIIETGTAWGGSALFFAMLCDLRGSGEVISVDIAAQPSRPAHDRIRYVQGSSTDVNALDRVSDAARQHRRVMVSLDSDHSREHVLHELNAYSAFVTEGCYLVVEDTNLNGNPVHPGFGPGPQEAVDEFLRRHPEFERDSLWESKFLVTFNPGGYLRRSA